MIEDTHIDPLTHRVYWFLQEYEGGYTKFGLLRNIDWQYTLGIKKVGETATFAMEEFGVVGAAQLMQIDSCPEIEMGSGRIATGWFEHSSGQLWELWIDGSEQPIRGTEGHPIWSNDRLDWVPLSELKEGESVQVQGGYAKDQRIQETEDIENVYTIEVDADHCYRIGQQGLLVHNASHSFTQITQAGVGYDQFAKPACIWRRRMRGWTGAGMFKDMPTGYLMGGRNLGSLVYQKIGEMKTERYPINSMDFVVGIRGDHAEKQIVDWLRTFQDYNVSNRPKPCSIRLVALFTERSPGRTHLISGVF